MTDETAVTIAEAVRAGRQSAVEVTNRALARVARLDGNIRAFVAIDADRALEQAAAVDLRRSRGEDPGSLAGVPIGVKDNEAVEGFATRHGSLVHAGAHPEPADSEHVARLRRAGAVILGKVATAEFGLDGVTHTLAHGTTRNPWNHDRTPGGSSGGSAAAVSAGLIPLCTGSDALGSIRVPAGFTGLVGLKPSHGRVARAHGFRPTAALGALTRTVADTARYLDVVSGPSNRDHMSLPAAGVSYEREIEQLDVTGLRVAWSPDLGFAPVEPEIASRCEDAVEALVRAAGLIHVRERFIFTNVYSEWNALAALEIKGDFERAGILPLHIERISPGPRGFIEQAQTLSAAQQSAYREKMQHLEREVADFFSRADILFTPTACCAAYAAEGPMPTVIAGRDASQTHAEPFTAIGSICWNPSVSIPVGLTSDGLPVGLLITGPRHADEIVLRLARIWEQLRPWPRVAPGYGADGSNHVACEMRQ
jgi:aspartyl-tRNA(Asn)/glutamyl-tRNA(Gln) amidotransferase subunit A